VWLIDFLTSILDGGQFRDAGNLLNTGNTVQCGSNLAAKSLNRV